MRILLLMLVSLLACLPSSALQPQAGPSPSQMFIGIAEGLSSGDIARFSPWFAPQVHVALRGGESGYFSANQAHVLLQGYMKDTSPSDCSFAPAAGSDASVNSTGVVTLTLQGLRVKAQVYVALTRSRDTWVITHLNVY
jgi:hypothetical protein